MDATYWKHKCKAKELQSQMKMPDRKERRRTHRSTQQATKRALSLNQLVSNLSRLRCWTREAYGHFLNDTGKASALIEPVPNINQIQLFDSREKNN